jgi:hypothetical protein
VHRISRLPAAFHITHFAPVYPSQETKLLATNS